jgi:hypothetical protein
MARKSSTAPPAIRAPPAAKSPRPEGSPTTVALLAVVNGALVGVGSVYLTTHSVLVTLIAAVSAGGLPCSRGSPGVHPRLLSPADCAPDCCQLCHCVCPPTHNHAK